mgnify:CR=1 FL=1
MEILWRIYIIYAQLDGSRLNLCWCATVPKCWTARTSASTISTPKNCDAFNAPCANIQPVWSQFVSSFCFLLTSTKNNMCLNYRQPVTVAVFFGSVRLLRWLTGLLVQPWRNATETFWSSPTFRPWPGNGIFVGNRTLVYISCLWNVSASNLGENWDFCRSYWQHMAN